MENNIMKLFKSFKLGNSVFKGCYKITKEVLSNLKLPQHEIERLVTRELVDALSNKIISEHQSAIIKEEKGGYVYHDIQLLVLKPEDFKIIVEATIQMMPDEAIQKIKSGEYI